MPPQKSTKNGKIKKTEKFFATNTKKCQLAFSVTVNETVVIENQVVVLGRILESQSMMT